jgi:hypothetical protein
MPVTYIHTYICTYIHTCINGLTGGDAEKFHVPEACLHAKTNYEMTVRAHNASGLGEESELLEFETLPDVPFLDEGVVAHKISCTSVDLGWDVPRNNNGAYVHNYELQVCTFGGSCLYVCRFVWLSGCLSVLFICFVCLSGKSACMYLYVGQVCLSDKSVCLTRMSV